jgi:hypothetical protein
MADGGWRIWDKLRPAEHGGQLLGTHRCIPIDTATVIALP